MPELASSGIPEKSERHTRHGGVVLPAVLTTELMISHAIIWPFLCGHHAALSVRVSAGVHARWWCVVRRC